MELRAERAEAATPFVERWDLSYPATPPASQSLTLQIGAAAGMTAPGRLTAGAGDPAPLLDRIAVVLSDTPAAGLALPPAPSLDVQLDLLGDRLSVGHGDDGATIIAGAFVAEPSGKWRVYRLTLRRGRAAVLSRTERRRSGRRAAAAGPRRRPGHPGTLPLAARTRTSRQLRARTVAIIEARGLARAFTTKQGRVEAVCGVDFVVEPGEIVGFLGPNGAGKTTTLRMLTTLLQPTAGSATRGRLRPARRSRRASASGSATCRRSAAPIRRARWPRS